MAFICIEKKNGFYFSGNSTFKTRPVSQIIDSYDNTFMNNDYLYLCTMFKLYSRAG